MIFYYENIENRKIEPTIYLSNIPSANTKYILETAKIIKNNIGYWSCYIMYIDENSNLSLNSRVIIEGDVSNGMPGF